MTFYVDMRLEREYSKRMAKRKIKTTSFGHALRVARVNAGLTQKELGEMIGANSHGYISMWENGARMPADKWLSKLLDVFPGLSNIKNHQDPETVPVRVRKPDPLKQQTPVIHVTNSYRGALDDLVEASASLTKAKEGFAKAKRVLDEEYKRFCAYLEGEASQ